jgi:hypothetical protein
MKRIKRRTRCRPHAWLLRFMYRAIWREPYQGVSKNFLSIIAINRSVFNALALWLIVQIGPRQCQ